MTYPGNLKINYGYTNGYQDEIRRDSDNSLIWQLQETSPTGQVEKYTNGNNLVTTRTFDYKTGFVDRIQTGSIQDLIYDYDDATGNLTSREDNIRSLTETFGYDDLNRLTSITFNSNTINIGIDENGNIDSKGDLGAYEYNTMQPHAVSKITPSVTYEPETQSATYTSFDKLDTLTQVNKNLIITYGHDFNRRKTVFTDGSSTKTKIFVPGGYEKINNETPDDEEYCYISTPAGITAVYDKTNDEMFYVHPDHLGSIHFITDESGTVEQELSFDAWGRQRNATNWGYSSFPGLKFERGYTFHEHLAEFDLINMNGRVYDPVMARFLSPDPMTQNPGNLQHYNRYAYVLNNPLKYTDPSGYRPYFQRATNEYDEPSESYTPSRWNGSGGGGIDPTQLTNEEWAAYSSPIPGSMESYFSSLTPAQRGNLTPDFIKAITKVYAAKGITVNYNWVSKPVETGWYDVYEMKTEFGVYYDIVKEIAVTAVKEYYLDPSLFNERLFKESYAPLDRAGNSGSISKHDASGLIGIDAGLGIVALAAHGNSTVSLISMGTSVGSIGINFVLLASTLEGIINKDNPTWGDWARLGMNAFFTAASTAAPFSGNIPGIFDFQGNFEYLYTQMDVLQKTGKWIYYNPYKNTWKSKNILNR